ncbi:MAG: hypothetical protein NUV81_03550 [bacterium]|nr:hypothetical protein [bacterium]
MKSAGGGLAKFVVFDLIGSIVWFPAWWYTTGLRQLLQWVGRSLRYRVRAYGFSIWIKNFFVPMYGQYDISGRLISVLMRFVVLIGRSIALLVEAIIYLGAVFLWLVSPIAIILFLLLNGATLFSL